MYTSAVYDQSTVKTPHAASRVTMELTGVIVPVPPERVETWRRGIASLYDYLDELILQDTPPEMVPEV